MSIDCKQIGNYGEIICRDYLIKNGYNIVELNYHSRYGEIDIIASDDKYLVFVEVKTRDKNSITKGFEAVDKRKMTKIIKTSYCFLIDSGLNLQPRFDVCEIYVLKNKLYRNIDKVENINYIKNAFDLNSINEII